MLFYYKMEDKTDVKGKIGHTTSVVISDDFFRLAKLHHIKFSEAMRIGLSVLFSEKGILPYNNKINIHRKLKSAISQLNYYAQEYYKLKEKLKELEGGDMNE